MLSRSQKHVVVILTLLILMMHMSMMQGASIVIIANPGPFQNIETAAYADDRVHWTDEARGDDDACTECFAAVELQRFLALSTSFVKNDIVLCSPEKIPPAGQHTFILGTPQSNLLVTRHIPISDISTLASEQSFIVRSVNPNTTVIAARGRIGVLYGAYEYLHQVSVRFYGLGEKGTILLQDATLPADLNLTENPAFILRGFHTWREGYGDKDFFLWMVRNRMNFWMPDSRFQGMLRKYGMILQVGGHDLLGWHIHPRLEYPYNHARSNGDDDKPQDPYPLSDDFRGDTDNDGKISYFEAHPEWYGLAQGKRQFKFRLRGYNFCTSNPDAVKEFHKNLLITLTDGSWRHGDLLNFWMLDDGKWCQCDRCCKLGANTDRLLRLMHQTDQMLKHARQEGHLNRPIIICGLAYFDTWDPPTRPLPVDFDYNTCTIGFFTHSRCYVHAIYDPDCTEMNEHLCDKFIAWDKSPYYQGQLVIGEYYNVSYHHNTPNLYTRIMSQDIGWFRDNGANGFHYMHAPVRDWGTWTINQYLLAQLLWDVHSDTEAIKNEYFSLYYPTTMNFVRCFYEELEKATCNVTAVRRYMTRKLNILDINPFSMDHLKYDVHHPDINDGPDYLEIMEHFHHARQAIDACLWTCTDPAERLRLLEDERRFTYGEEHYQAYYHFIRCNQFYHQNQLDSARRELEHFEVIADRLRKKIDIMKISSSSGADNRDNAFEALHLEQGYEKIKTILAGDDRNP